MKIADELEIIEDDERLSAAAAGGNQPFCASPEMTNATEAMLGANSKREGGDHLDEKLKGNGDGTTARAITRAITTTGEIFADGSTIELIGGAQDGNVRLMLWDGARETVGERIEHHGKLYEPAPIRSSILEELVLPASCRPHGSTPALLAETCKLVEDFIGLPQRCVSIVGRFVLCSWLVEAAQVALALVLVGPDTIRANRLVSLLHCLCRHGLRVTGLTPAGLRSLPSGAGLTLLVSQPTLSDNLESLLNDASRRDLKIPYRGGLLDLFGAQVIHAESISFGERLSLRSIQVSMIPDGLPLPAFDFDVQHKITVDFQPRLLGFRRANLRAACKLEFDASRFCPSMRGLTHSIAAATPDNTELQTAVLDLLREEDEEIRAGRWVESSVVAVEAMLVAYQESPGDIKYVSEIANEILRRRGSDGKLDPGVLGKRLTALGFRAEPRDAKGMRIRLTAAVARRAQQFLQDFGAPRVEDAGSNESAGPGA